MSACSFFYRSLLILYFICIFMCSYCCLFGVLNLMMMMMMMMMMIIIIIIIIIIIMRPSSLGGGRILRRTLSVRLSVRPVIVTERHVAPPSELQ